MMMLLILASIMIVILGPSVKTCLSTRDALSAELCLRWCADVEAMSYSGS